MLRDVVRPGSGAFVGTVALDGRSLPDRPIPGAFRVEILSSRLISWTIPDPEGLKGSTVEERKNVVSDHHGSRSQLQADITQAGLNSFHSEIDSKPDRLSAGNRC